MVTKRVFTHGVEQDTPIAIRWAMKHSTIILFSNELIIKHNNKKYSQAKKQMLSDCINPKDDNEKHTIKNMISLYTWRKPRQDKVL